MALHPENYISLYSGGGGLDLGFRLANPAARSVLYVEREFQAAALLVDHIEAGLLEPAPVWSDSGTLDCEPFIDRVDWIIGGFPCQPWSVAGKQLGTEDPRWLWPHIERITGEVQPRGLFLENVPALISGGGLAEVLRGLASLGYDAEWLSVRASDVGAPHRRERVFILAHSQDPDRQRTGRAYDSGRSAAEAGGLSRELAHTVRVGESGSLGEVRSGRRVREVGGEHGRQLADNNGKGRSGDLRQREQREPEREERELGDSDGPGSQGRGEPLGGSGDQRPAWETGSEMGDTETVDAGSWKPEAEGSASVSGRGSQFPPGPGDTDAWATVLERRPDLAPAIELPVRGMDDGTAFQLDGLPRTARLRILGNGVVPQQAALAFRELAGRLSRVGV